MSRPFDDKITKAVAEAAKKVMEQSIEEKAKQSSTNEEVEQIDELDREGMLSRYIKKTTSGDLGIAKKGREKGRELALKKKWGNKKFGFDEPKVKAVQREEVEVEQIDELSRKTLANYIGKARERNIRMSAAAKTRSTSVDTPVSAVMKDISDMDKRSKNLRRAYDKVVKMKEEVEQINEKVQVVKKDYSWGRMVTVHHGASHSYPLHPEHQEKISKLKDGESTTFKDERNANVTARREGENVHLSTSGAGSTKTTVGMHHFKEEVEVVDEATAYSEVHKQLKKHVDPSRHKTLAAMIGKLNSGADEKETVNQYHFGGAQSRVRAVLKKHGIGESVEQVDEKLIGKQHKLDANKNGKVDAQDFKIIRNKKGGVVELRSEEVISLQEVSYNNAMSKYALDAVHDFLGGGNKHVYGSSGFDHKLFGVDIEKASRDFKKHFNDHLKKIGGRKTSAVEKTPKHQSVAEGYTKGANKSRKNLYTRMLAKGTKTPSGNWKGDKAAATKAGRAKLKEGFLMEETSPQLASAMKGILADAFHMYFKAHTFHWNVEGANFPEYHQFFGTVYEQLFDTIDPIAEEIRALGEYAPRSLTELKGATTIEDSSVQTAGEMFSSLLSDNDKIIAGLTSGYKVAEASGEIGLSNFLQDKIDAHKKLGWMIKSTSKGA